MNGLRFGIMKLGVSVSFYVRKQASKKTRMYPVVMRVSLQGKRETFGQIGISLEDPNYLKNGVVTKACANHELYNSSLQSEAMRVHFIADGLSRKGELTLCALKEAYNGEINPQATPNLLEVYAELIAQ